MRYLVIKHSGLSLSEFLKPIPHTVEFPSLAPLLHGELPPTTRFSYYKGFQRMVRTKTHKFILYPEIWKPQLFDIQRDPWEMHDLANDPALNEIKMNELTP